MECWGTCNARARVRRERRALQRARHRDGEVAAAEFGQDGVARGGSSIARGRRAAEALARRVGGARQAGGGRLAQSGGGSAASPAVREEAGRQAGGGRKWTGLQF